MKPTQMQMEKQQAGVCGVQGVSRSEQAETEELSSFGKIWAPGTEN